jgi:hypothetical protein
MLEDPVDTFIDGRLEASILSLEVDEIHGAHSGRVFGVVYERNG